MQTVHHLGSRGKVIPLSACTLRRGRSDQEFIITPEGYTGTFWVDLDNEAKVSGVKMSEWDMKRRFYQAFYGKDWSKVMNEDGWVR